MASRLDSGLWQGFIIPEHRKALWDLQNEQQRRERPVLDEQELEQIGTRLLLSMNECEEVSMYLFDPFESKMAIGVVVDIDIPRRRVKLQQDDECSWIKIEDIIEVF
ncbi:YolD-like family protein [Paenibacillus alvei]|uniref:YolD-like family protein n=1 Tax=Paenibacillus alvei TaxID=44250 RepID=UPI0013DAD757|nr:YolD-like family protein [Paenibacillus alvei]NEZ40244.1 YolD-like family protein [Paenibacillus alvei]